MHIIKLNATDSTNSYLKDLTLSGTPEDYTVVIAEQQRKGRGQMGTVWESESGKNLTFSILKLLNNVDVTQSFALNMHVSLALYNALKRLQVPRLCIKWPNDILSGTDKLCGILIENILSGKRIQASVIGIGLNINQTNFNTLTNVSSLKLVLGKSHNVAEILQLITEELERELSCIPTSDINALQSRYEKQLFRKDKPSTFEDKDGQLVMGFIKGVSAQGKLRVALEDAIVKEFDLKELRLLY